MGKTVLVLASLFFVTIAHAGPALEAYLEQPGQPDRETEKGTLSSSWRSLPKPVFEELLKEPPSVLIGYLSKVASLNDQRSALAKRLLVTMLYFDTANYLTRGAHHKIATPELLDAKPYGEKTVTFCLPRGFIQAVERGFPREATGWRAWFDAVTPRVPRFSNAHPEPESPRIWVLNVREKPVGEVLKMVGEEAGIKVFYTPPEKGDPKIGIQRVEEPALEIFSSIAKGCKLRMVIEEDGVHFTASGNRAK